MTRERKIYDSAFKIKAVQFHLTQNLILNNI